MYRFRPPKLHVGCGDKKLPGWINLDLQLIPGGPDVVMDVTQGLYFSNVKAIYAEHFLEHLPILSALEFLRQCNEILGDDGALRLSTPNLDWVWLTHYNLLEGKDAKAKMAVNINRAFNGWEHMFLWNREFLVRAMEACGLQGFTWHTYGNSDREVFKNLEKHDTYPDTEELPHILVVEASRGEAQPEALEALKHELWRDYLNHMKA